MSREKGVEARHGLRPATVQFAVGAQDAYGVRHLRIAAEATLETVHEIDEMHNRALAETEASVRHR